MDKIQNQRKHSLETFKKVGIMKNNPISWHIWKQAFDEGVRYQKELVKNNGGLDDVSVRFLFDFVNEFTDIVIPMEAIEETFKRLNEH